MMRPPLPLLMASLIAALPFPSANATEGMTPTGKRCAGLGEFCSFSGTMMVHIAGCKSIDKYNGGCASSKGIIASNGMNCTLAAFGLKAPLPNVGINACYVETLAEASVTPPDKAAAKAAPRTHVSGASCVSTGVTTIESTIVINQTSHDGQCKTYNAGVGLRRSGSETADKPMFRLENGATLKNLIIGESAGQDDGIHITGSSTLDNVRWPKLRSHGITIRSAAPVTLSNISANNGNTKPTGKETLILADSAANLRLNNCAIELTQSVVTQATGKNVKLFISADKCQFTRVAGALFVSDNPGSEARLTNSHLIKSDTICKGPWLACNDVGNFYY